MKQEKNMNGHVKNSRGLIAGGAGFIGSHLCDRLINEGHRVLCIDNLYTGRIDNVQHLLKNSLFTYAIHDVTAPMSYDDISLIFNLACPASPIHYKNAVYTTKTAVVGTLNLLELAKTN